MVFEPAGRDYLASLSYLGAPKILCGTTLFATDNFTKTDPFPLKCSVFVYVKKAFMAGVSLKINFIQESLDEFDQYQTNSYRFANN